MYQKYADELIILLGTGLRISEFCGLTTNLDLKNRGKKTTITVDGYTNFLFLKKDGTAFSLG